MTWLTTAVSAGSGGLARNRTGVQGFAVLCVTTPPRGLARAGEGARSLGQGDGPVSNGSGPGRQGGRRVKLPASLRQFGAWQDGVIPAKEPPRRDDATVFPDSSAGRAFDC